MNKVEQYINQFDEETKSRLLRIRELVNTEAPEAEEGIMYGIVGYKINGKPLVYFGGYPKHIGFYATPNGHEAFAKDFAQYKQGKGSVQFPLDEPLPVDLIKKVIEYRKQQVG